MMRSADLAGELYIATTQGQRMAAANIVENPQIEHYSDGMSLLGQRSPATSCTSELRDGSQQLAETTTTLNSSTEKRAGSRRRLHQILESAHAADVTSRTVDIILILLISGTQFGCARSGRRSLSQQRLAVRIIHIFDVGQVAADFSAGSGRRI